MQITMEIIVSIFLVFGSFFMLVGSIGMVRLPDLFMRLHAPTKSSTLGLGSFLIASMIFFCFSRSFWLCRTSHYSVSFHYGTCFSQFNCTSSTTSAFTLIKW